jgi:hypothetical protein
MPETLDSSACILTYNRNALHAVLIMPNGEFLQAVLEKGINNNSVMLQSPCGGYSIKLIPLYTEAIIYVKWNTEKSLFFCSRSGTVGTSYFINPKVNS